MDKLTKKSVKLLKKLAVDEIIKQINSSSGYRCEAGWWDDDRDEWVSNPFVVNDKTEYIPAYWHAGIDNGPDWALGRDISRLEFASEEAKRKLRDMLPSDSKFITWAWYN